MATVDLTNLNNVWALDYFLAAKEGEHCAANTIRHYRWRLERFVEWLHERGIMSPAIIEPQHLRLYYRFLQETQKASSVSDHATTIKTWLRFLWMDGVIPTNATERVKAPKVDDEVLPIFTKDDIEKLLAVARTPRDRALILFMLDSGCRVSEVVAVDLEDVDRKSGQVTIRHGKGGKSRTVFLGPKARKTLLRYRGEDKEGPLFTGLYSGDRWTIDGVQTTLRRLGERAGVANCTPHTFRRTFATLCLDAGMDVFALQRIMGHADLKVLMRYVNRRIPQLQAAHKQFGPVDHLL